MRRNIASFYHGKNLSVEYTSKVDETVKALDLPMTRLCSDLLSSREHASRGFIHRQGISGGRRSVPHVLRDSRVFEFYEEFFEW